MFAVLNVLLFLVAISAVILSIDRGFDITDEAFYLLNIRSPNDNIGAVSEFGQYLSVFGSNVVRLRFVGLLGLLAANGFLAYQVVRLVEQRTDNAGHWSMRSTVAAVVLLTSFGYYRYWLLTPSYNWFASLGATVIASAGILAFRTLRRANLDATPPIPSHQWIPVGLCLGTGGILAMIGRPTSALALGVTMGLWCIITLRPRYWMRVGLVSVSMCALFIFAHIGLVEGSRSTFLSNITFAMDLAASLGAGQTLPSAFFRFIEALKGIPDHLVNIRLAAALVAMCGPILLLIPFALDRPLRPATVIFAWQAAVIPSFSVFVIYFYFDNVDTTPASWPGSFGLEMNIFAVAALLVKEFALPKLIRKNYIFSKIHSSTVADTLLLMLFLCFLALAVSFGSTSEPVEGSGTAFGLYATSALIACTSLLPNRHRLSRTVMLTFIGAPTVVLLLFAMQSPYRLPTRIEAQSEQVTFADGSTVLRVDNKTATWINGLLTISEKAGWRVGTPLIDLTGATPGAALVLSAHAPTTPWLVGGYPGSLDYTHKALSMAEPAVLRSAWILTAPDGGRRIDTAVLGSVGLDFPESYALVGSIRTGYRDEMQFLWKPESKQ